MPNMPGEHHTLHEAGSETLRRHASPHCRHIMTAISSRLTDNHA
ncbi:MAG: hypothetical protein SO094_07545 [Prevotella sp.]|nr:hypothetical protein [Prevotella sp.]